MVPFLGGMLRMIEGEGTADRNYPRFRVEASEVCWNHGPFLGHRLLIREILHDLRMLENRNQGTSCLDGRNEYWCFA